jgi:hypothetical protein
MVLLIGRIYDVCHWEHLSDIWIPSLMTTGSGIREILTWTIWEATMLVSLMRIVYDECHWEESVAWHICTSFMKTGTAVHTLLRLHLRNMRGCNLVLLMGEIYKCADKMGSGALICIPSFMKIGRAILAILRFCLSNLKCCDVGITDWMDLWSTPLRWLNVAWYITFLNTGSAIQTLIRDTQTDSKVIS